MSEDLEKKFDTRRRFEILSTIKTNPQLSLSGIRRLFGGEVVDLLLKYDEEIEDKVFVIDAEKFFVK
jgi:hypothetical protein